MTSIIVEGPDGSGKSTLVRRLLERTPYLRKAPRACTSMGGPCSDPESVRYIEESVLWDNVIFDRHPCISGPVYDTVLGRVQSSKLLGVTHAWRMKHLSEYTIIYCRPSTQSIVRAVLESDHMPGVAANIRRLIEQYDCSMDVIRPDIVYSWQSDELPNL